MFGFASCNFLKSSYLLSAAKMKKWHAVPRITGHSEFIGTLARAHISPTSILWNIIKGKHYTALMISNDISESIR